MTTTTPPELARPALVRTGSIAAVGALPMVGQLYVVLPLSAEIGALPGAGGATAALASTLFAVVYAVGILGLGPLADAVGARRLMIASAAATAVVTMCTAFAPSASWFLLGRAAQGLAAAAFTPATLAYIARTAPMSARVPLNTAAIGAGLASAVVSQVAAQLIAPAAGITGVFLAFAAAAALAAVAVRTLLPGDAAPAGERPSLTAVHRAIPGLLARPRLVLLYCTGLTFLSVLVALYTALGADGRWSATTLLILRASSLPAVIVARVLTLRLSGVPAQARILGAVALAVTGALLCSSGATLAVGTGLFLLVGSVALAAPSVVAEVTRLGAPAVGAAASLYTVTIFGGASLGAPLDALLGGGLTTVALGGAAVLALGGLTAAIATRN
ncbi:MULTISPECIES: MFS transporter [Tsukamurella]|uniref:MFS transporter n=2 Tax=Tsukamurella TaxID=2060 RepID=A0A5C5S1C1_9ACTN|nr:MULTISPECIES: MFS transporter [Tsukamurella]NMD54245.1 MFS transporter [Tsukamurella columbiensis]TWS28235.1 MFS transporter [Tsukamurella conjunctivitidis]